MATKASPHPLYVLLVGDGTADPRRYLSNSFVTWIPPLLGTGAIESETRRQYQQLLAEMLRRTAQRATPAAR